MPDPSGTIKLGHLARVFKTDFSMEGAIAIDQFALTTPFRWVVASFLGLASITQAAWRWAAIRPRPFNTDSSRPAKGRARRVAAINGQLLAMKLDEFAMVFEAKGTRYWMCKQCPASALMPLLHKLVPAH
jgi:hypothetical protein